MARPSTHDTVLRSETLKEFGQATRHRLALVCAPAGYGKTTAAAAAVERLGLENVWYKLDVLDRDPVVFLASLTEALRTHVPGFGDGILDRLKSVAETPFPIEHMQAMFVGECDASLKGEVHFVLDDYHEVAASTELNRVLDYLLVSLPSNVRFVMLTRYDPAFSVSKMRLAGDVKLIDAQSLRFDTDQSIAVLAARTGRSPRREHMERLVALTEGWPASIVLAGLALEWLDVDSLEVALADPRLKQDIYSYLAEQVYRQEDEATRAFLKRTCCLENITAELANRVAGTDAAHRYLAHLAGNRVFTFATGVEGAYRYHNQFRDFLKQRCLQNDGELAYRRLQHDTATALEDVGETEMAVELYLSARQPVDALAVIARSGEAGLEGLPAERLHSWLQRLPPESMLTEPWAMLMAAQLHSRSGAYALELDEIGRAVRSFECACDEWGLYHALSMRECALFWQGNTAEALQACEAALAHAQTGQHKMHTLLSLGSAALDMRRWAEAETAFTAADQLAPFASPAEQIRAKALRGHAAYYQGDFETARAVLPLPRPEDTSDAVSATVLNTGGLVELGLANYAQALGLFDQALAVAERLGCAATSSMIEDNISLLKGAQGHFDEGLAIARRTTEAALQTAEATHAASMRSHEATLLRRAGRLEAALEPCTQAACGVDLERDPYVALNSQTNLAFLLALLQGRGQQRLLILSRRASTAGLAFVALKAQLYAAIVATRNGHTAVAAELLSGCLPCQLRLGHLHLLAQELCPRPEVARIAMESATAPGQTDRLMQALASHWSFADLIEALLPDSRTLAAPAIRAAGRRASDDTLARILTLTQGTRGSTYATAVSDVQKKRPRVEFAPGPVLPQLTKRERQILRLMAEGRRNNDIAAELFLSLLTVKTHVNHVFTKLGVKTRVQAVLAYKEASDYSDASC